MVSLPLPWYVAVEEGCQLLAAAGFKELKETEKWNVKPNNKYYVTRNKSTLIAFAIGGNYQPGNGFAILGAHTDSPCLKVKPISKKMREDFLQVGVECYGGGSWHTWFDRDLTIAGRVIIQNGKSIAQRLFHINKPILRIPNVAIHLERDMGTKFEWNKENHLTPILATKITEELLTSAKPHKSPDFPKIAENHHSCLISAICGELDVSVESIIDFELCLTDTQPAAIGGLFDEFIFSPRLDNLHSCFCAIKGLVNSTKSESFETDTMIRMMSLFDNEEVGSETAQGGQSTLQELIMRRLCSAQNHNVLAYEESIPKSLMVSCDMAHAVHPNYTEKHEDQHKPNFHKGVVIKTNQNQRYATTAITGAIMRKIAELGGVSVQEFVVRNDTPCGSTLGPLMSAKLGIPTVDVGAAQLSMHSIREMCDTTSVKMTCDLFESFYKNYSSISAQLEL
ncbi:DgyrCDS284 [Dimorphilus gyrociliatus]|uniref:Aspartyl aminopeptidase n=1 Tax=Dimorphilus gyrociliatus TaxID=2664684 RepID=A0A7I8V4B5_9ANNE|nr:DgyrCDS284 [Dimorphilus gyrociliatus]